MAFAAVEKRYVSRSERILQNAKNVLWKRAALKVVESRLNVATFWQDTNDPRVRVFILFYFMFISHMVNSATGFLTLELLELD